MRTLARAFVTLLLLAPLVASCGEPEKAPPAAPPGEATAPPAPAPTPPAPAPAPAPTPEATPSAEKSSDATPPESAAPTPTVPAREVPSPQDPGTAPEATPAPPAETPEARPEPAPEPAPAPAAPPRQTEAPPAAASADLPTRPEPAGKVILPAKLGPVTFDHGKHVSELKIDCATCHHESRPEKPLGAKHQSCRECHTQPAVAPMKTSLRSAVHDAKAIAGLCADCHRDPKNQDRKTPAKCADCHRKTAT